MNIKNQLREKVQKARDGLTAKQRLDKSKAVARKFIYSSYYKGAETLLLYYPFRSEIDTTLIIGSAFQDKKKVLLPKVDKKDLKLYQIRNLETQLQLGSYGIMEPIDSECRQAQPVEIDLVLVPGIAFDRKLNRLGYGSGYYDRFLGQLRSDIVKVGLCYDLQLIEKVPISDHDIKIDVLITESEEIIG